MKITLTDKNGNQVLAIESSNPVKDIVTTTLLRQTIESIDIQSFKTSNARMSKLSVISDRFIQDSNLTLCIDFDIIKISRAAGDDIVTLTNKLVDILNKTDVGRKLIFLKMPASSGFYIYDNIAEHESDTYDVSVERKNIKSLRVEIDKSIDEKLKELRNYLSTTAVGQVLKNISQKYKISFSNIKKDRNPSIRLCDEYHYFSAKVNGLLKYLELDTNPNHLRNPTWFDDKTHSWKWDENNVWASVQFKNNCSLGPYIHDNLSLPKEFEGFNVRWELYFESIYDDGYCWIKRTKPIAELVKIEGDDIKKIRNNLKEFDSGNVLIYFNIEYSGR